jgi:outer membrane immunogenic protein
MRHLTLALLSSAAVFAAGAATAADMPVKAPPRPAMVAPAFSWTGFYIGVNAGYGWGEPDGTFAGLVPNGFDMSGWLAGGQVGFNYQFPGSGFVIGIEADYQWAGIEGDATVFPAFTVASAELDRFGTVRGRVGFAWDRFMIYGTGGWAFGAHTEVTLGFPFFVTGSATLSGWTAGGGIEWAFAPNWSAKLEYLHLELDNKNFFGPLICVGGCGAGLDVDLVRLGVNWRFGGWLTP